MYDMSESGIMNPLFVFVNYFAYFVLHSCSKCLKFIKKSIRKLFKAFQKNPIEQVFFIFIQTLKFDLLKTTKK